MEWILTVNRMWWFNYFPNHYQYFATSSFCDTLLKTDNINAKRIPFFRFGANSWPLRLISLNIYVFWYSIISKMSFQSLKALQHRHHGSLHTFSGHKIKLLGQNLQSVVKKNGIWVSCFKRDNQFILLDKVQQPKEVHRSVPLSTSKKETEVYITSQP